MRRSRRRPAASRGLLIVAALTLATALIAQETSPPAQQPPPPAAAPNANESQSETNRTQQDPADAYRTPKQPSSADILKEMEKERPTNVPVQARSTRIEGAESAGDASPGALLREGEVISKQAGRLTRDGQWWSFAFESDSPESPRPPMRLLPNQELERMVAEAKAADHEPVFIVTGDVTLFESMNYMLVVKALRSRDPGTIKK